LQMISIMKPTSRQFQFLIVVSILGFCLVTSAQTRLILNNGGRVKINGGAYLVIDNPAANAITRNSSGHIISEGENNILKWNIGTTAASYTIPWGDASGNYFPVTFTTASATGGGYFHFSTYPTASANTPFPTGVTNINGASGVNNSLFASDRFWQVNAQGYTVKPTLSNLLFTYRDVENASPNTITESDLKANRYNSLQNSWTDRVLNGSVNPTNNTVTVTSVDATELYNWWTVGVLGANRYWVASTNSNSNLATNWSETSGGTGNVGVPTYRDAVFFDNGSTNNCTIDANLTAASLLVTAGYTGIISQGANTITLNNGATFSGGTFTGGTADILVTDAFTLSGASFTSTTANLDIKSDFSFTSGSFAHNGGTVRFSGTGTQNISGSTANFNNIQVTNSTANPGLRIQSNQNLVGVLTLASDVVVDADGSGNTSIFRLMSSDDDPTQDASIATLPSGAQVTGSVTVQRFMTKEGRNNTRIYRYISSPVQNGSVADLQNEIPITGSFTGSSICSTCLSNQSMFLYDETITTDINGSGGNNFDDGYIDFPNSVNTETLVPGRGYAMFVSGNILSSTSWDIRGPINAGNVTSVSLPVNYTSTGQILNDGWNLVGNPFPSTIDWNSASGWTKTNLDGTIYISDNGSGPALQYATWNGTTGTNNGSRYIATGQAFWTKANGSGAPTLQANENVKVAGTQTIFFREGGLTNLLRVTMFKGAERDEAVIHFREDATRAFDRHADAWKLKNGSFNFSSLSENNEKLAINSSSPLNCSTEIKLSVADAIAGQYSLKFTNLDSFEGAQIVLNDLFLNQSTSINDNTEYPFTITTDSRSHGTDRFLVLFTKTPPPVAIQSTQGVLSVAYTDNIQWYYNDQPITGANAPTITPDKTGTYSVKIQLGECELRGAIEFVVTEVEESLPRGINVFPNPVANQVSITSDKNSLESVILMSAHGETIGEIQLISVQGRQSGNFDMSNNAAGLYFLKIVGRKNTYLKKLIKN
jgi:hypothetical protein